MVNPSILIVEDEHIVAEDMRDALISLGYRVAGIIHTGEEAVERSGELNPDLITMDIHLAGKMDGITAAQEIGTRYHIPVIYVTAFADVELLERARITTPYGYLIKPFENREIHSAIEIALYKHHTDEELREKEATIRTMLNATSDLALLSGTDGQIISVNNALAKVAGKTVKDISGQQVMSLFTETQVAEQVDEGMKKALYNAAPSRFEGVFHGRWCDFSVIPVTGTAGRTSGISLYAHDITERKHTEEELKRTNENLAREKERLLTFTQALDAMTDAVAITDALGTISYVNNAFRTRFGYEPVEMQGKRLQGIQSPDCQFALSRDAFLQDQKSVWAGKMIVRNKYGRNIPTSLMSTPVIRDNRTVQRIFVLREMA